MSKSVAAISRRLPVAPVILAAVICVTGCVAHAGGIPADTIQTTVIEHVTDRMRQNGVELDVTVPAVFDVAVRNVNDPKLRVSVKPRNMRAKRVSADVEIIDDDGEVARRIRVVAHLAYYADAVVAGCDIGHGDSINTGDLEVKKAEVTGIDSYYTSPSQVDGMQAKKLLRAGTVITESDIRPEYVVTYGDRVKVKLREGDVLLYVEGTARGNGARGETIRVYIDMTKITLPCKIIDAATVEAGFEGG